MDVISTGDSMSFDEKDKFWSLLFERISSAILSGHDSTVAFGLHEVDGIDLKDAEDYSLIIESDQYEIFLQNYIKFSEGLERYEACARALNVLELFTTGEYLNGQT